MTNELTDQAAYNNALWCDAVCSTHYGSGEFRKSHWLNRFGVPRYYPDLVTLTGFRDAPTQTEAVSELVTSSFRDWFVKDSFCCLDLHELGFELLFDAKWLSATSLGSSGLQVSKDLQWARVTREVDLNRWEDAWARSDADAGRPRMFRPGLLSKPEVHFIYALVDGVPVGGGILSAGAGVIGLSNLFGFEIDLKIIWHGLSKVARATFPGLPLVAYDRGRNLAAAHRVGFATIGSLRIWRRTLSKGT